MTESDTDSETADPLSYGPLAQEILLLIPLCVIKCSVLQSCIFPLRVTFFCWWPRVLTPSFLRQQSLGKKLGEKLYHPGNIPQKCNWRDFYWLMIERVTQQVWNWRWGSNLSDTSNAKATFPDSWKYHISSWSSVAFSSLEIVFPYFLKWVCFPPEDHCKITALFHSRKSSWSRRVTRVIYHIFTQITQTPQYVILNSREIHNGFLFSVVSSCGKGLISNSKRGSCKFSQREFIHCWEVVEPGDESTDEQLSDSGGLSVGYFV